jgi:hypothetical protein
MRNIMNGRAFVAAAIPLSTVTLATGQNYSNDDFGRRTVEGGAIEAVTWGMPAVNFDLMYQARVRETKGSYNHRFLVSFARLTP